MDKPQIPAITESLAAQVSALRAERDELYDALQGAMLFIPLGTVARKNADAAIINYRGRQS